MSARKLLVLPVTIGTISFATENVVSVSDDNGRLDINRSEIIGRQPERHEQVIVLDIQDIADALRDGDDELAEYDINGTVVRKTTKAVYLQLVSGREVSLPSKFITADIDEYVREARLPRWLALDRGL